MTMVSIIMPMRNAESFVKEALISILQERHTLLEVVVVDDGSTDRSREFAQQMADVDKRLHIIEGPCRGFSASFNTGLTAARGDVLMQCDADDLYPAGRIATQIAWLAAHPEYDAVCGALSMMDSKARLIAEPEQGADAAGLDIDAELRGGIVRTSLCTFAMRRRVIQRIGMLREYFETSPDIDFQFRLGEACRVAYVPTNTYFYRLHESSITHRQPSVRRVFFEEMAREFQRQRHTGGADALMLGTPPEPPAASSTSERSAHMQIHGMLVGQAWRHLQQGRRRDALGVAARAVMHSPARWSAWRTLALITVRTVTSGRGVGGKTPP